MGDRVDDDLNAEALDITKKYLLGRSTLKELAVEYHRSAATLHRRLTRWLDDGRFELIDTAGVQSTPRVLGVDSNLSEELTAHTKIWRAHVGTIEGADGAYSEDYLEPDWTAEAQKAFQAHDRLHEALGELAAGYLVTRLQRRMTIGVASGRGVGFTVMRLADILGDRPSLLRGYESTRIESLFGGALVGAWATPTTRALDADENAFQLSTILNVPRANVSYMRGWISGDPGETRIYRQVSEAPLDLALVGMGVLNTRNQFYVHHDQNVQLGAIAGYIETIKALQAEDSSLLDSVATIGHYLFPVGVRDYPDGLLTAVNGINDAIIAVPPERIKTATEVVMLAGGAQKVTALVDLLTGQCLGAPIDLDNLTLVTDAWTARQVLERVA
jgi:DNA-binding transcriptional regulator LsrR (DeoR family)